MFKKMLAITLAAALTLSLTGCCCTELPTALIDRLQAVGQVTTVSDADVTVVTVPLDLVTTEPEKDAETAPHDSAVKTTTRGGVATTTWSRKQLTTTKRIPGPTLSTLPNEAMVSQTNFGGNSYAFAHYGTTWNADWSREYADFEREYNANLKVTGVSSNEYVTALSAAMASGRPYDIITMCSYDFPSPITENVATPLEDYFSAADLWDKANPSKGGFSQSLVKAMSMDEASYGVAIHYYGVGGPYLQAPMMLWYNKKMFAQAGFTDPLQLYYSGEWNWDVLYEMLYEIQDPEKGLYGINSISPYYSHWFINTYDTDLVRRISNGEYKQNMNDSRLYSAFEMLQKYCYGEYKVANPHDLYEDGSAQFLNGATASMIGHSTMYTYFSKEMEKASYKAFGTQAEQLDNVGAVPLPCPYRVNSVAAWFGYGAGNGTTEDGIRCALAFAKYDSRVNHRNAYTEEMPYAVKKTVCEILDNDSLIAPVVGFECSSGSIGGTQISIATAIANKGQSITVLLKGYTKFVGTILSEAQPQ